MGMVEAFVAKDPVMAAVANLAPKPSFLLSERLQKRVIQENSDPESNVRWRVGWTEGVLGQTVGLSLTETCGRLCLCRYGCYERLTLFLNDKESS